MWAKNHKSTISTFSLQKKTLLAPKQRLKSLESAACKKSAISVTQVSINIQGVVVIRSHTKPALDLIYTRLRVILKIVWPYKDPFAAVKKWALDLINTHLRSSKKERPYNRTNAEADLLPNRFFFRLKKERFPFDDISNLWPVIWYSVFYYLKKSYLRQKFSGRQRCDLTATHLRKKTFC